MNARQRVLQHFVLRSLFLLPYGRRDILGHKNILTDALRVKVAFSAEMLNMKIDTVTEKDINADMYAVWHLIGFLDALKVGDAIPVLFRSHIGSRTVTHAYRIVEEGCGCLLEEIMMLIMMVKVFHDSLWCLRILGMINCMNGGGVQTILLGEYPIGMRKIRSDILQDAKMKSKFIFYFKSRSEKIIA